MSAEAALLPCPICSHTVFDSAEVLRDRLVNISTNKILCPVCQEEVIGLDKLTIHLFSHINISSNKGNITNTINRDGKCKTKPDNSNGSCGVAAQTKKCRAPIPKSKAATAAAATAPVKFVKIYPKLPVLSLNTLPVIEISTAPSTSAESQIVAINNACNVCGLQFLDANILRMHKCLIHNISVDSVVNVNRYPCHLCSKSFKMKGSLMVHLRVAHYGFSSDNCSTRVDDPQGGAETGQSQAHGDHHHSCDKNDNKQWQCEVCKKCFTTKYFLKKHKRLHTGETPYACTQCNKTFTFQQSYHKHLLYHNDEKPHICTYCGRAFKELSTLHNHQRIHTGEKPFSCETCGKCFRQRVSYLVHKRIHTGVMPYKCTACDKSFRYKVSQRTHKCQAQPPGTVVRQSGDLIEKLLKKHEMSEHQESTQTVKTVHDITETHAELVRTGAKLSLEDTEAESFNLIADVFNQNLESEPNNGETVHVDKLDELVEPSISDLIDFDTNERNLPSPSEILRNLCLSKKDDCTMKSDVETNFFNVFL